MDHGPMDVHRDGHLWTGDATHAAPYTAHGLDNSGEKIPLLVYLPGHPKDLLGAFFNALFAAFTAVFLNPD